MLTKIEIENFKSIYKETIELGRVNVFIGENGCGKTNILEAVGMASAYSEGKTGNDELASKGLRVTKPSITFSSFSGHPIKMKANIDCTIFDTEIKKEINQNYEFTLDDPNDILSSWKDAKRESYVQSMYEKLTKSINKAPVPMDENWKKDLLNTLYKTGPLSDYCIFHISTQILRGLDPISRETPGVNGENLDLLISSFSKKELEELLEHTSFIPWLDEIIIDKNGRLKREGHNLNMGSSALYFRDKFMQKKNNIFSAENANEGILHILFYLALFISKRTPKFFAIDNIETALNPHLCRALMEELIKLAKKNDKQVLITTHNPAILDGLNLHDDEVRLFVVSRDFKGHTRVERLKIKPDAEVGGSRLKMSELWMRGYLGAIPHHF